MKKFFIYGILAGLICFSFTQRSYAVPDDWLQMLNYYRAMAGLPPVWENKGYNKDCKLHAENMVKTGKLEHFNKGNASLSGYSVTDAKFISDWMATVYHGIPLLNPALIQVGFGSYNQKGAALNVDDGVISSPMNPVSYPIYFPGDGSYMPLWHFGTSKEYPDPLKKCQGYSYAGLGPPIFLQTGDGSTKSDVTSTSFLENGVSRPHCVLDADGAIVILPKNKLNQGYDYKVSITVKGKKYEWSFTTWTAKLWGNILFRHTTKGYNGVWLMGGHKIKSVAWLKPVYAGGGAPGTNLVGLWSLNVDWRIVGAADFNNDGKTDILWRHAKTGQNELMFMEDGTSHKQIASLDQVADLNWDVVGTGDFNQDSHIDILWYNPTTGKSQIWLMDVYFYSLKRTSIVWLPTNSNLSWKIVGTGDFDGDYLTDILWRNTKTGQNAVWYMSWTKFFGDQDYLETVSDLNWKIIGTGDFNDDNEPDILWRHASGFLLVWYMDGAKHTSSAWISWIADPNWKIVGTGKFN